MGALECPGVGQVLGTKARVGLQDLTITGTLTAEHDQRPDGDPCPHDASIATADVWSPLNAREGIAQISNHRLEKLGLLSPCHPCQELFGLFDRC